MLSPDHYFHWLINPNQFSQNPVQIANTSRCTSSETQGEGKSKREEKYGTKKSKERREEPLGIALGTMYYQTSSKRSPPFCLVIGARKLLCFFVLPQGLFSPFFTFIRAIFSLPFRPSLARPTICPGSPRMVAVRVPYE